MVYIRKPSNTDRKKSTGKSPEIMKGTTIYLKEKENLVNIESPFQKYFNAYIEEQREQALREQDEKEWTAYQDARIKEMDQAIEETILMEYLAEVKNNQEKEKLKEQTKKNIPLLSDFLAGCLTDSKKDTTNLLEKKPNNKLSAVLAEILSDKGNTNLLTNKPIYVKEIKYRNKRSILKNNVIIPTPLEKELYVHKIDRKMEEIIKDDKNLKNKKD